MKEKLPVFAEYSAGATRTKLKLFSNEKRSGYGIVEPLFAKRNKVGKHEGRNSVFVFVNETCPPEEAEVAILLQCGYDLAKVEGIEAIVWVMSSAARESGVLMVVPINFEFKIYGYKNRTPAKQYRVTRQGVIDVTLEVFQENQVPV